MAYVLDATNGDQKATAPGSVAGLHPACVTMGGWKSFWKSSKISQNPIKIIKIIKTQTQIQKNGEGFTSGSFKGKPFKEDSEARAVHISAVLEGVRLGLFNTTHHHTMI